MSRLARHWKNLDGGAQVATARALYEEFPESVGGHALLAALADNKERWAEAIGRRLLTLEQSELEAAGTLCARVGLGPLTSVTMLRAVKIADVEQQAITVLGLIPYLPRAYPVDLMQHWQESGAVGAQISSLTRIVEELGRAISADALSEVVKEAARKSSEWWIVEAMTSTLRRSRSPKNSRRCCGPPIISARRTCGLDLSAGPRGVPRISVISK